MEGTVAYQMFESIFKRLTDAVVARDSSFYHVRFLPPVLNKSLAHSRQLANEILATVLSNEHERAAACNALNNDSFLGMGVTTHSCSCTQFCNYNACKHVLGARLRVLASYLP
jgi:hypothetical protein